MFHCLSVKCLKLSKTLKGLTVSSLSCAMQMEHSASVTMDQSHCLRVVPEHPPLWSGPYPGFFPNFKVIFCLVLVYHCYIFLLGNKFISTLICGSSFYIPILLLLDFSKESIPSRFLQMAKPHLPPIFNCWN